MACSVIVLFCFGEFKEGTDRKIRKERKRRYAVDSVSLCGGHCLEQKE